ncbi:hypothetical protein H8E88_25780 [candidate division KSB1 bacterium]|nr:hypothetical protein [candidate division KSB1 bacterium]
MSGILDNSMSALYEETDLLLAEQALASDLKLLEGLIKTDPGNEKLLLMASQGFGAYALGFVEDENSERAKNLYLRGKGYGFKILNKNPNFQKSITGSTEDLKQALASFSKKDVPALFWTANNWANWINLNFNNPDALIDLPRVQLLMERVLELDESYFFGGAHLFFATIYAVRPPILGGDIKKSEYHFNRCFNFSSEKFLLPYVYYAQFYLTRQFDEDLFVKTLEKVLNTPGDILPGQQLPNAIAKEKARKLLNNKDEHF